MVNTTTYQMYSRESSTFHIVLIIWTELYTYTGNCSDARACFELVGDIIRPAGAELRGGVKGKYWRESLD